jgi:hypothetical protein
LLEVELAVLLAVVLDVAFADEFVSSVSLEAVTSFFTSPSSDSSFSFLVTMIFYFQLVDSLS